MKQIILILMIMTLPVNYALAEMIDSGPRITFTKDIFYTYLPPGEEENITVRALDINGTNLYGNGFTISNKDIKFWVSLGGQLLNVLHFGKIKGSIYQQVVVQVEKTVMNGTHLLRLWNANGESTVEATIGGKQLYFCPFDGGASAGQCSGVVAVSGCVELNEDGTVLKRIECRLLGRLN